MFDTLSEKLQGIIQKASGNAQLTQENMNDALREIRRSLLEADVNLKVVKAFITSIREKAEGENAAFSLVMLASFNDCNRFGRESYVVIDVTGGMV